MPSHPEERSLLLAGKTEPVSVHLMQMSAFCRKSGRALLFSCARGGLCGAAVGFFFFLHLGVPKDPEFTGYISGLFVVAGLKFGLCLWAIRDFVFPLVSLVVGLMLTFCKTLSKSAQRERLL